MQKPAHLKPLRQLFMTSLLMYGLGQVLITHLSASGFMPAGSGTAKGKGSAVHPVKPVIRKNGTGTAADACIVWDCGGGVSIQSWHRERGLTINHAISGYGSVCQSWAQCE